MIIGIGICGIIAVSAAVVQVLTDQLVCSVILIREAPASLCDRGDVSVCVVGITVRIVVSVRIGGNERGLGTVRTGKIG